MNQGDYFIMLYDQYGSYMPMEYDDYNIAKFKTYKEAYDCASKNALGESCGFEVFNINEGCLE